MFFGLHERQLDDKGRVALPVAYRAQIGERLYLTVGASRCIAVWAAEEFERNATDVAERVRRGELSMAHQRSITHSASEVTVDKQGRVKVDERLLDFARLAPSTKAFVTGNYDHLELWSEPVYTEVSERQANEMALGE